MKKIHGILGFIIMLLMTACGPATPADSTPSIDLDGANTLETAPEGATAAEEQTAVPEESGAPTSTPPPLPESYPPPAPVAPAPAAPEAYPAAPVAPPPAPPSEYPAAYPSAEEPVWIIRPVGEQCADVDQNSYANLQEAVAALTAAGLMVGEAEMTNLVVCSACGCPTSAHYRIEVASTDVATAVSLGWEQE